MLKNNSPVTFFKSLGANDLLINTHKRKVFITSALRLCVIKNIKVLKKQNSFDILSQKSLYDT